MRDNLNSVMSMYDIYKEMVENGLELQFVFKEDVTNFFIESGINQEDSFRISEDIRKGKGIRKDDGQMLLQKGVSKHYLRYFNKVKYLSSIKK